jgi:methionyl-tRNA formyltransferase
MRLVMMGTGQFAEPTLETLLASPHQVVGLVTQPDRPVGQERGSTRQTGRGMKTIALEHHVPVFQPERVNTPEGVAWLQAQKPELLVVAAYGQILSKDVLATTPHGGINVHSSLLPKYRGAAPVAWAIYHGETRTGVTIIKMSVAMDAGNMLAQEAIDIGPDETAGELEARLAPLGAKLVLQVIDRIAAGTVQGIKQDPAQVTKAPKLQKEHGLIDWSRTAEQVCNQIRAMQPWPTAYTFLHQSGKPPQRVILTKARPWGDHAPPGAPGAIFTEPKYPGLLFVAAGPGSPGVSRVVSVSELQPAGKRRMAAADFLRGHPLRAGDHFGPETA